jgi:hypothetical protein
MKVVVLLSKTFSPQHPKAGQETNFREKLLCGIGCPDCSMEKERGGISCYYCNRGKLKKIHTCRSNYEYWKKKIDRLKAEGGVLSIRQWSGKPYRSPQDIIVDIPASEIDVQKLGFGREPDYERIHCTFVDGKIANFIQIAHNDGLSANDFEAWFENCDLTRPVAIIHFTKFRY